MTDRLDNHIARMNRQSLRAQIESVGRVVGFLEGLDRLRSITLFPGLPGATLPAGILLDAARRYRGRLVEHLELLIDAGANEVTDGEPPAREDPDAS